MEKSNGQALSIRSVVREEKRRKWKACSEISMYSTVQREPLASAEALPTVTDVPFSMRVHSTTLEITVNKSRRISVGVL